MDLVALVALTLAGSWLAAPVGRSAPVALLGRLAQGYLVGAIVAGFVAAQFESRGVTSYALPLLAAIGLAAIAAIVRELRRVPVSTERRRGAALAFAVLAVLVLAHTLLALLEVRERPPYPWDAWTNWLFRARAWYLEPGVTFAWAPDAASGATALQVPGAHYPASVPGLVAWLARLSGEWSWPRLLLAWPLAYAATSIAVVAFADQALRSRTLAVIAAIAFATAPFVVTHAMLAGYADLFLTGTLVVALAAAYEWRRGGRLSIATVAAFAVPVLVKIEGLVWIVLLVLALALAARPRLSAAVVAASVLALVATVLVLPEGIHLFGERVVLSADFVRVPYLGETQLTLNPVFGPLVHAALLSETFGVAFWAIIAAALAALPLRRRLKAPRSRAEREAQRVLAIHGGLALTFTLALFAFTVAGRWAVDQTSLSRVLMQTLPLWLILAARVFEPLDPRAADR